MKVQNRNASRRLTDRLEMPSWELVVLIVLLVTVLGVALRSPLKSFPDLASRTTFRQSDRDPYDLHPERAFVETRDRVETGF
jgi:hypothetical protein